MPVPLQDEDIAWLKSYTNDVRLAYRSIFDGAKNRFEQGSQLLDRFQKAIDDVLENGRGRFMAVDEAHNELCIAAAILTDANSDFVNLAYEPALPNCNKTIDFRAESANGPIVFVDVKTIKPRPKDRWDQYERAVKEGWFPKNVAVTLNKEWLGGELWHNKFAARSRMLEYTLELEQKIFQSNLKISNVLFTLVFCGEGFYWHEDELEDFVSFYFSGTHRSDDPFALAETKYIKENALTLSGTVSRFACMRRPQSDVHVKRLNWNVKPPDDPTFL